MSNLQEKLFEARYCGGYVLRDVLVKDTIKDIPNYVGILLGMKDGIEDAHIYVPKEYTFKVHSDSGEELVDAVLLGESYNVFYTRDGVEHQKMMERDALYYWYYKSHISVDMLYYDLMRVPVTSLGFLNPESDLRSVSWQSMIIQPGLMVSIMVNASDILYIPEYDKVEENLYMESNRLSDCVNINLSGDEYRVSYKSVKTGWRVKTEVVSKHEVMQDYLYGVRARLNDMSREDWMRYVFTLDDTLE